MVAATFPHALRLVLVDEGGLDDDPHDHGGRTAHGIIQREYDGFRARHNLPRQELCLSAPRPSRQGVPRDYYGLAGL